MRILKFIAALFIAAALCFLLGGCATLDRQFYDQEVRKIPGQLFTNTVYETNVVILEYASTNSAGVVTPEKIGQVVQAREVVQNGPPVLVTNLVPRPSVQTGIQAAGAVPVPWAGTAALALGWVYSAYASVRNKQIAKALLQSVQVGREFLQSTPEGQKLDAAFKAKLQRHQQFLGVASAVKGLLNRYVPDHTQPAKG